MSTNFPVHPHWRPQFWIGGLLALWLYLFLVFVGPFDSADLSVFVRSFLMVGYGIVFWLCYLLCIVCQNWWFLRRSRWTAWSEFLFSIGFALFCLLPTYAYYCTDWVNGTFSFAEFALWVYLPTLAILIPIMVIGRYLIGMQYRRTLEANVKLEVPLITLTGDNKLDVLRLPWIELLAVSAADNYVTIYFVQQEQVQKRLLRSTLKRVKEEVPELLQIHRSHLINPSHFRAWGDAKTIQVNELLLPVSKKYKPQLEETLNFTPQ